ncbi:cysteine desulfurase [Paenibacillus sp. N1-5-1-14]|uniref:cysteine desulfurase family protein n=1 Tax=Paenibacillus radicibacter TaxID=2972488 RepID=UPI002158E28E|nr:cysteine desulfurase family protein [Paenibacillus radicibacter]MCR8644086.1 cysteine desulfurase [Paenibacillus radicibacter]
MKSIYFDYAATSPLHPDVLDAMLPYLTGIFGNASSLHAYGREARNALNRSRDAIAKHLGCQSSEIIFTSGGTESNNLALFGVMQALGREKKHIITSQIEHHSVLHPCQELEKLGYEVTYLGVDSTGRVAVEDVANAIRPDTALISVMYGNNEVGTIQPIEQIGEIARKHQVLFHVDGVQALGKIPLHLSMLPVDLMSFSAHKIYGPKGVGALYVSKHVPIHAYQHGGKQERKRRGGTENVAGIVGFAKAVQDAVEELDARVADLKQLRQGMINKLKNELGPIGEHWVINGHPDHTLPHILNISLVGLDTETLLMNLDLEGIAAASGSACTSGSLEISHVLKAMHLPENVTLSAVRFSVGIGNSMEEIDTAAQKIATILKRTRM